MAREAGGYVVLDDTQALGVLGPAGGGSLRKSGEAGDDMVLVASLAKGFGVPIAMLGGSAVLIGSFRERSETMTHCSPPSIPSLRAAEHALALNTVQGDHLRDRLMGLLRRFRQALSRRRLHTTGGMFPVQTIACPGESAQMLYDELLKRGVRAVLHKDRSSSAARVSLIITAGHSTEAIDCASAAVIEAVAAVARSSRTSRATA
jgi:8-amino-7-oxononanoate synthase